MDELEVSIVDRTINGQKIRMVKVVDSLRPRRCGYAPVADDISRTQIEAAIVKAAEDLKAKRKSST